MGEGPGSPDGTSERLESQPRENNVKIVDYLQGIKHKKHIKERDKSKK